MSKLTPIPREDLPRLRELFLPNWPKHIIGHDLINNYIQWYKKAPEYSDATIYSLNDDWSNGTFIIVDRHALFVYSLHDDLDKLTQMVKLLPANRSYLCSTILKKFTPALKTAFAELKMKQNMELATILFILPKEKCVNFSVECPTDVELRTLSEKHVVQINAIYPFHTRDTHIQFTKYVNYNVNFGVFEQATGELMGWCLRHQSGLLTALQVEEQHKRRGLAELLVKAMVKEIAVKEGDDTTVAVVVENIPSRRLFKKVGFEDTEVEVVWLEFNPTQGEN